MSASTPPFGGQLTGHVLLCDHADGAWGEPRIVPTGELCLPWNAAVLQYSQSVFEGLKAYRTPGGGLQLFRPADNAARLRASAERLAIPYDWPDALFVERVAALVARDAAWLPTGPDACLYVRPVVFATSPSLAVAPAEAYTFVTLLSPASAYFDADRGLSLKVERSLCRAAPGGTGAAKTAGNYAGSLAATRRARAEGFDTVLWTDATEHRLIEEAGEANVFFVRRATRELLTPSLERGTILPGITRRSVITLAAEAGWTVREEEIDVEALAAALDDGSVDEAFATGTAAVVVPIQRIDGRTVGDGRSGELTGALREQLVGIQHGRLPDPHGWTHTVPGTTPDGAAG